MSETSKNLGPGDLNVTLCNIISNQTGKQIKDLSKRVWHAINFTESMGLFKGHTPFLSGSIIIGDAVNITDAMGINIDDIVELEFKTPQKNEIYFRGRVYQIKIAEFESKRALAILFCSAEKLASDRRKLNDSLLNMSYSKMAEGIWAYMKEVGGKNIVAEKTRDEGASYIINNKSPLDAINSIKKIARSAQYKGANYVFYERSATKANPGEFRFESIERLVDKPTTMTYYHDAPPPNARGTKSLVRILSYNPIQLPNLVSMIQGGAFSGIVISNDLMKRQISTLTYNYHKEWDGLKSTNPNSIGGDKTVILKNESYSLSKHAYVEFVPKHYGAWGAGLNGNYGDDKEETALVRNSQLLNITAIQMQIIVPGDSNRRVGEIVDLQILSKGKNTKGKKDERLSDRYMITNINHSFTPVPDGYKTIMHLVKDNYGTPLPSK